MSQAPELAGGAGFTFEDRVVARALVALLCENAHFGLPDYVVTRVAQQQRGFRFPLDDLVIDGRSAIGEAANISFQVKRALTISAAATNEDFRSIVRDSWDTLTKIDFQLGIDRFGAIAGEISEARYREVTSLCELARASTTPEGFAERFGTNGTASADLLALKGVFEALLAEHLGRPISVEELHRFLQHFVIARADFMHDGAAGETDATNALRDALIDSHACGRVEAVAVTLPNRPRGRGRRSTAFSRKPHPRTWAELPARWQPVPSGRSREGHAARSTVARGHSKRCRRRGNRPRAFRCRGRRKARLPPICSNPWAARHWEVGGP